MHIANISARLATFAMIAVLALPGCVSEEDNSWMEAIESTLSEITISVGQTLKIRNGKTNKIACAMAGTTEFEMTDASGACGEFRIDNCSWDAAAAACVCDLTLVGPC